MHILMLNEMEVQRLLDLDALLDALAEEFRALSEDLVSAPKRNEVSVPNTGFLLAMPAYRHGREVTVKLVSVFHGNERLGIPGHQALICLFDPQTGTPSRSWTVPTSPRFGRLARPPSRPGFWHARTPACWLLSARGCRAARI